MSAPSADGPIAAAIDRGLATAVQGVGRAVVRVMAGGHGVGSGIVWRSDGLIVTNAHVAHHTPMRVALQDGRTLEARVISADEKLDVAVLSVEADELPAIGVGDARSLKVGELVLAHGHPWGVTGAVTSGVVIGMDSDWPGMSDGPGAREWLVVNMRLRPGNSGGPIVDVAGRVVGISTIMAGPQVGMAVPAHVADALVADAIASPVGTR